MPGALTDQQADWIRSSFESVKPRAHELVETFYTTLFLSSPELRTLFPEDLTQQHDDTASAIALFAVRCDDLGSLAGVFQEMGRRHASHGAQPDHYPIVRDVLIASLRTCADEVWCDDLEEAWTDALNVAAGMMLEGAERARLNDAA